MSRFTLFIHLKILRNIAKLSYKSNFQVNRKEYIDILLKLLFWLIQSFEHKNHQRQRNERNCWPRNQEGIKKKPLRSHASFIMLYFFLLPAVLCKTSKVYRNANIPSCEIELMFKLPRMFCKSFANKEDCMSMLFVKKCIQGSPRI